MGTTRLPELSRFELQCLGILWSLGDASIRDVHGAIESAPSYSTVKKIFERLEEKGAVRRVGREGKSTVFRSAVKPRSMIRKEIRRLLDAVFAGEASSLVAHLADMRELTLEDLREIERSLVETESGADKPRGRR